MYGQKKDEDVYLKYLRDFHDGEHGLYSGSLGNSLGREARQREQRRAQEAAQAERAHIAAWERQQAAQRAERRAYQDMMKPQVPAVRVNVGWRRCAAISGEIFAVCFAFGLLLKALGLF